MPLPALLGMGKAISWITDPRNRTIVLIVIVLLILGLIGYQFKRIGDLKVEVQYHKAEASRIYNNWQAARNRIKTYILDNGDLKAEISGYKLSYDELQGEFDSLFSEYTFEKNKPPRTIIKPEIQIVEKIVEVPIYVKDSLGNKYAYFKSDTIFGPGNSRIIEGYIPYTYVLFNSSDSTSINFDDPIYRSLYVNVVYGKASILLKQRMTLLTGLSYDEETKRPIVWVQTSYPGVQIVDLVGADIFDSKESRKAFEKAQKQWGLGLHLGAGYQINRYGFTPGLYVGIGVNWTPPILRW